MPSGRTAGACGAPEGGGGCKEHRTYEIFAEAMPCAQFATPTAWRRSYAGECGEEAVLLGLGDTHVDASAGTASSTARARGLPVVNATVATVGPCATRERKAIITRNTP